MADAPTTPDQAGEIQPDHEHVFVEEQEPSGRLVLGPCLVCELSAMDAMEQLKAERDGDG